LLWGSFFIENHGTASNIPDNGKVVSGGLSCFWGSRVGSVQRLGTGIKFLKKISFYSWEMAV